VAAFALGAAACAQHHTGHGLILRVDRPGATVTISHEALPGFMDAMAMPFDLKGAARQVGLTPGDRVRFRLSVRNSRSWVDRVEVVSAAPVDAGLQQTPVTPVLVSVGSPMPDFELTDQSGAALTLSALKGKVEAVTFIN
jgi:protein SCO1/2